MKISEVTKTLIAEKEFERTPNGRSMTEIAINTVIAALDDQKNYDQDATKCLGCGFVGSSLLAPKGCPNCNGRDLSMNLNKAEIL